MINNSIFTYGRTFSANSQAVLLRTMTWLVLGSIPVAWTGCGASNSPELGAVSGKVTLDGNPLEGAIVQFTPDLGRGSRGRTGPDGSYELKYVGNEKGALLGEHKVTISTRWIDEDPATGKITQYSEKLPAKYNAESDIRKTVVGGQNTFDFTTTSQ